MINDSLWSIISNVSGSISFCASFISLFPQIIETYHDKTVDGLSPYFLLCWLLGDITSLIGALMTNQLLFQILLAVYFLLNDLFVCGQYYYYGIIHKNKLATMGHETVPVLSRVNNNNEDNNGTSQTNSQENTVNNNITTTTTSSNTVGTTQLLTSLIAVASNTITTAEAMTNTLSQSQTNPGDNIHNNATNVGIILSWIGASFYVGARIPQLIKNYKRKSTDGLSPFLFATTLLGNITYNVSILTSTSFIYCKDKIKFIKRTAPFIFGSAGTVIFDLIYFYQYYVLYADDTKLRTLERELLSPRVSEETPLLS